MSGMDRRSISQEMYAEEQPRGGACVRAVGIAFVVFSYMLFGWGAYQAHVAFVGASGT
jgi:hypothetical protein